MNKNSILIFLLIAVITINSCNSSQTKDNNSSSVSTEQSKTEKKSDAWASLVKFDGTSKKNSQAFDTKGGQLKIVYKVDMTASGKYPDITDFELTLTDKDQGVWGSPDVMLMNKAESSETYMQKPAGKYFVHIETVGAKYEVEVFEQQ